MRREKKTDTQLFITEVDVEMDGEISFAQEMVADLTTNISHLK